MNRLQKYPRLLPHRFKKIGLLIALSGIVYIIAVIIFKIAFDIMVPGTKVIHENISYILQIIGLSMRSISKEKNEDELILQLRLRSLSGSLFGAAGIALMAAIFDMIGDTLEWSIPYFVVFLLWIEQLIFWNIKKKYFKENS